MSGNEIIYIFSMKKFKKQELVYKQQFENIDAIYQDYYEKIEVPSYDVINGEVFSKPNKIKYKYKLEELVIKYKLPTPNFVFFLLFQHPESRKAPCPYCGGRTSSFTNRSQVLKFSCDSKSICGSVGCGELTNHGEKCKRCEPPPTVSSLPSYQHSTIERFIDFSIGGYGFPCVLLEKEALTSLHFIWSPQICEISYCSNPNFCIVWDKDNKQYLTFVPPKDLYEALVKDWKEMALMQGWEFSNCQLPVLHEQI